MAKQRDARALRDAVRSSEFTPAMREVEALVDLLGDADAEIVRGAEQALRRAAAGGDVTPRIVSKLGAVSSLVRARALRVLGAIAPNDGATVTRVVEALNDSDDRVKRAAAHALGRLGDSESQAEIAAAVILAWDDVPALPLARALAEAMGKLGIVGARSRLEAVFEGDAELARIARKAVLMLERDSTRRDVNGIVGDRVPLRELEVAFQCRPGLENVVIEELFERCASVRDPKTHRGRPGEVTAFCRAAPAELMTIRTMIHFAFNLPEVRFERDEDIESACVAVLTSDVARRILETWTVGKVRYRVEWEGRGHRRGTTWRMIDALHESEPEWVNDPTGSPWQFSLDVRDGVVRGRLAPRGLPDSRFLYRIRDVPAASHPTIAAALVRASRPKENDVVWDPFAGSGSELIERAIAGPYARLLGTDIDSHALEVAEQNRDAAGYTRESLAFQVADATLFAPSGVNAIITNPPMGRRVARDGSLATLLDAFTDHAAHLLVPGGRLVWLSPLGGRTAARAEANRLHVTLRQTVDMGGFQAELQVWQKD